MSREHAKYLADTLTAPSLLSFNYGSNTMKSWRTTTAGILAIVTVVAAAFRAELDADPATVADWSLVVAAVVAGFGLIMARDNSVTSEVAGAK